MCEGVRMCVVCALCEDVCFVRMCLCVLCEDVWCVLFVRVVD